MNRRLKSSIPALALAAGLAVTAGQPSQASQAASSAHAKPTKVVIIVVDALSREIVDRYGMSNVKALMRDQVNSPNAYLGHLGSVTVVTHNVITTGVLPKHMGWTDDGYRDVSGQLGPAGDMWIASEFTKEQMFKLQTNAGYPKLADYLHVAQPGSKVVTISPKQYAAWGYGGSGSDTIITFGSKATCPDGKTYRMPGGVGLPAYITDPCGRYYVHQLGAGAYDTSAFPASLYSLDGDRYTTGKDDEHLGGDVWATDAALDTMAHESNWSGIFVTLPDVDKAAHMWGSVDDTGGEDPMTHLAFAAKTADAQVGRIVNALKASGEYDHTLVVLTADHGSVPGKHFYGTENPALDAGYDNWYYGATDNGTYLSPQAALKPLIDTGNVDYTYSDSMLRAWLKDTSPAKLAEAAAIMSVMPGVSATWIRSGDHYNLASKVRTKLMPTGGEKSWFARHAQELVNTEAAPYGPDIIATLVDDTTYSVAGDHGGIQRRSQQIPIVFAGAGLPSTDLASPIRSVDIMPTILRTMGIQATTPMDGIAYRLPGTR